MLPTVASLSSEVRQLNGRSRRQFARSGADAFKISSLIKLIVRQFVRCLAYGRPTAQFTTLNQWRAAGNHRQTMDLYILAIYRGPWSDRHV